MTRVFILWLLFNFAMGQEVLIIDDNNNPIPNVFLFNESKSISVLSNISGEVNISRFNLNELIYIQHPIYESIPIRKVEVLKTKKIKVTETVYEIPEIFLDEAKNTDNIKNNSEQKIFISRKEINKLNTENIADLLKKRGYKCSEKSIWRRKP